MPKISNSNSIRLGANAPNKIYLGANAVWTWSPARLPLVAWYDASDASTITLNGSTVSQWSDKSGNNRHATQATAANQPTTATSPNRIVFDKITQKLVATMPATTGTMILSTSNGTAAYEVNIPAGSYDIVAHNGLYMPDKSVIGQIICSGSLAQSDKDKAITWLRAKGGGSDYSSITIFTAYWRNWSEITSFPTIDTSNGTSFLGTWRGCSGLTSFPLLATGKGTDFSNAWNGCSSLTSFPAINCSLGTNFSAAWLGCSSLTSFPLINTGGGTNFLSTWQNCSSLTSFPFLDTSNALTLQAAWSGCSGLTSFPLLNTSKVTNFQNAWTNCTGLSGFPLLNTSSATNVSLAWYGCNGLTSFPTLDVSKVTTFNSAWYACYKLTSFPLLNVQAGTIFTSAWRNCTTLVTFPANFFDGCLATNFANAFTNTKLSQTSIDNILVSINSNNTSNGTFDQSGGSAPSATGQAAITAMRSRGWTVSVTGGF